MPAQVETVIIDTPLDGDGAHVDLAESRPGDTAGGDASAPMPPRGPCLDLVVRNPGPSLCRGTTADEVVPSSKSLGVVDSGVV
jgi:hypothetical protein